MAWRKEKKHPRSSMLMQRCKLKSKLQRLLKSSRTSSTAQKLKWWTSYPTSAKSILISKNSNLSTSKSKEKWTIICKSAQLSKIWAKKSSKFKKFESTNWKRASIKRRNRFTKWLRNSEISIQTWKPSKSISTKSKKALPQSSLCYKRRMETAQTPNWANFSRNNHKSSRRKLLSAQSEAASKNYSNEKEKVLHIRINKLS